MFGDFQEICDGMMDFLKIRWKRGDNGVKDFPACIGMFHAGDDVIFGVFEQALKVVVLGGNDNFPKDRNRSIDGNV